MPDRGAKTSWNILRERLRFGEASAQAPRGYTGESRVQGESRAGWTVPNQVDLSAMADCAALLATAKSERKPDLRLTIYARELGLFWQA
jgi:hypothetical protein